MANDRQVSMERTDMRVQVVSVEGERRTPEEMQRKQATMTAHSTLGSAHTPGPWIVEEMPSGVEFRINAPNGGDNPWRIAMAYGCCGIGGGNAESKANAHLITAAPDMLAALKRLTAAHDLPEAHRQAHDAITKAEGHAPMPQETP